MRLDEILSEAMKWGKVGPTWIYSNPTRMEFVGMMSRLRAKYNLGDEDVVLRGFLQRSGGVLVFDGWHATHQEIFDDYQGEISDYNCSRLSFWQDSGVVGVGTLDDAGKVMADPVLLAMMGGPFEVEECY